MDEVQRVPRVGVSILLLPMQDVHWWACKRLRFNEFQEGVCLSCHNYDRIDTRWRQKDFSWPVNHSDGWRQVVAGHRLGFPRGGLGVASRDEYRLCRGTEEDRISVFRLPWWNNYWSCPVQDWCWWACKGLIFSWFQEGACLSCHNYDRIDTQDGAKRTLAGR